MNNILVVDNSFVVRKGLEIKLKRAGFKPFLVSSKEEAISAIAEQFIHFFGVIMEVELDDVDNHIEFIEFMTQRRIATIVLSTINNDLIVDEILKLNIIEFIYKEKEEDLNYCVDMINRISNYKEQKALVVHKDFSFLQNTKKNMEALMFNVLVSADAKGALKMFENHNDIKLALINYELNDFDGFELVLKLRKKYSKEDLIIIAITPLDKPSITSMFLKYGSNGYVSSKCTRDELNYTISNLMDVLHNKEEAIKVKQQIQDYTTQLSKYISPQIYKSIMDGEGAQKMEARKKKLTIFFLHIADFTDISESMESNELTYWLNEYLKRMSNIALLHGATIDKFIGDAVMIFFGAPNSNGVAMDALACSKMALDMQEEMIEFRKEQRENGVLQPFHVKAGMSTGFVTVGNFGNADRMDYTIIGGFVNLAARLEHAAKADTILIPEETYQLVKKFINVKKGEKVFAKGFPNLIQTYEVISVKDEKALSDESNETLRDVLKHIDRGHVKLEENVVELLTDISGINDHIRR